MPIKSASNQSEPWRRQLELQREHAWAYFRQVVAKDYAGSDRPVAELERSIVLSCFAMNWLIARQEQAASRAARPISLGVYEDTRDLKQSRGAPPCSTDLLCVGSLETSVVELSNDIVYLAQILVVSGDSRIPDGMLISFERRTRRPLLLLPIDDFMKMTECLVEATLR